MEYITIEWNDKFSSPYDWYEIQDLISESEWDLPPQDLLNIYIHLNKDKINNHIWTNVVHRTLKKLSQTYNYKYDVFDFRDKHQKCNVILYRNPNKINKYQKKFWLVTDEDQKKIKKYYSLEEAQDDLFLNAQHNNQDLYLLETKNHRQGN